MDNYCTDYWVKVTITGSIKVTASSEDDALNIVDAMSDDELKDITTCIELEVE